MRSTISILLLVFTLAAANAQSKGKESFNFTSKEYNFGNVKEWNNPVAEFVVTNTGSKPLIFLPVRYHRDVQVTVPSFGVPPGQSASVRVRYYTEKKGSFNKKIELFVGQSQKSVKLTVKGDIESFASGAYMACPSMATKNKDELITADIVGQVIDEYTGEAIKGAKVFVTGDVGRKKDMTSGDGMFDETLKFGLYRIEISAEGYEPIVEEVYFNKRSPIFKFKLTRIGLSPDHSTALAANPDIRVDYIDKEPVDVDEDVIEDLGLLDKDKKKDDDIPEITRDDNSNPDIIEKLTPEIDEDLLAELEGIDDFGMSSPNDDIPIVKRDDDSPNDVDEIGNAPAITDTDISIDDEDRINTNTTLDDPSNEMTFIEVDIDEEYENPPTIGNVEPTSNEPNPQITDDINLTSIDDNITEIDGVVELAVNEPVSASNPNIEIPEETSIPIEVVDEPIKPISEPEEEFSVTEYSPNNIIFLLDVSFSMGKKDKLALLQLSMKQATGILRDVDKVSIITYNRYPKVVLPTVRGAQKDTVAQIIDSLKASGLTYGVKGLEKAYEIASTHFIEGGNNQIILATDGMFTDVNSNDEGLTGMVRKNAKKGIKLSILSFGDDKEGTRKMKRLTVWGKGSYLHIENQYHAKQILVDEIKANSLIEIE